MDDLKTLAAPAFSFALERTEAGALLRFQVGKAGGRAVRGAVPDYRRYTGVERELLREFLALCAAASRSFSVDPSAEAPPAYTLINPDDRFIEHALRGGLLRTGAGEPLSLAGGLCHCAVRVEEEAPRALTLSFSLCDEQGGLIARGRIPQQPGLPPKKPKKSPADKTADNTPPDCFSLVSPRLAWYQNQVYPLEDLGPRWTETDFINCRVQREELEAFLSLAFSRFTNLRLVWAGWTLRRIRPAQALPSLLFMEIDRYGYLHLRPIAYLRGFPPLFLENEEITAIVETDETDRSLGLAEVVFPEPPDLLFRALLLKAGKADKTGLAGAGLKDQIHEENGRFIIAPEFARIFFAEHIVELARRFVLLEATVLAGYKLSFSRPQIRLSMSQGLDFLSGSAEVEIDGQSFPLSRFMAEYRSASCITLADGTRSFPEKRTMERLDRLVSLLKGDEDAVELSCFDIPLLLQEGNIEVDGAAWEKARPFFSNYNSIAARGGAWKIAGGELRPYQEYGVRWLDYLREYGMGGCLADEMGLGKTIQVIALLRTLYANYNSSPTRLAESTAAPCLILCPKSLVFNWQAELERFAPELPVLIHYGADRDFEGIETGGLQIILSTYTTLRRDIGEFQKVEFFYIILDESQNIKNLNTQTAAAVMILRARHKLAISGTPVENNLADLYSLFRFLNPAFFGSQKQFVSRYLRPIQEDNDEDALRDLKARIYPFMLRRLKRDVLKDLPPKSEETALIELDEAHLEIYHRRRLEYQELIAGIVARGEFKKQAIVIFKALSELRRLASAPEADVEYSGRSAKRQYLLDLVSEPAANGHKCLIFTNFLANVENLSNDLAARGIANLTMTGATSDRQSLVRRFQTDAEVRAFIMTLKTGGTGLNLTAADYIFIFDPWWNAAAESQAIDRAHRIGQANPVFCYRLIARDTIEERILELQKHKADLAGALLSDLQSGEDSGLLKSLSAEDITYLMGASHAA
ncbi:MAG: DEAD/DEAH box helicase [Treponema sp.]|jgi:superfamily II DNA or RNA helicase|nr:DEAD/DEAH box helicase [Treponema sp.]